VNTILEETRKQEDDPISVRILRAVRLAGKPQNMADPIVERVFAPPPKGKAANAQAIDEKLMKQQALIEFMAREVEELTSARKQKLGTFKNKTQSGPRGPIVTDATCTSYYSILDQYAPDLKANTEQIEQEQRRKPNYNGLRAAVIRVLKADESLSDSVLSQQLGEHPNPFYPPAS
jgi:hypothetical protein